MSTETKRIKADNNTLLKSILNEVRDSEAPIEIEMDGFAYTVNPMGTVLDRPTEEQIEATKSSFGSWRDIVDGEELKRQIIEARSSDRSFPSL